LLVELLGECRDTFAFPDDASGALIRIAEHALGLADGPKDDVTNQRLVGLLSVLLVTVTDNPERLPGTDGGRTDVSRETLDFVHILLELVFGRELVPLARHTGIRVIAKIVFYVEQQLLIGNDSVSVPPRRANPVSLLIDAFAARSGFKEWETERKIESFPVLWPATIDDLFHEIWRAEPVSSDFGQTMLLRLKTMDKEKFIFFVRKHNIVQEFVKRLGRRAVLSEAIITPDNEEVRRGTTQLKFQWLNPFALELANEIATSPERELEIEPLTNEEKASWEKFGKIVARHVLGYFDHIQATLSNAEA
jgi:hypothetical protein